MPLVIYYSYQLKYTVAASCYCIDESHSECIVIGWGDTSGQWRAFQIHTMLLLRMHAVGIQCTHQVAYSMFSTQLWYGQCCSVDWCTWRVEVYGQLGYSVMWDNQERGCLCAKLYYVTFITSSLEEGARNVEKSYILQETEDMWWPFLYNLNGIFLWKLLRFWYCISMCMDYIFLSIGWDQNNLTVQHTGNNFK